ncbi:MAG: metal ABC transporter ATP-binding protein [Actinomycetes bacterium]
MSTEVLATASGLTLGYGNRVALAASDFTVPHHAVTAIIGPNGSGKSTLLNALAGILDPMAGTLHVLGGTPGRRGLTSYVMQSLAFPSGTPITVREAVAMGLYPKLGWFGRPTAEDRDRVQRAMERLRITDLAKRHLDELSGGQRQRVYVAQGITQQHEALLLDEPLTGLDLVSARTIDEIIHSERERGHAVVLTTHDLDEARAADWVVITSGRVIAAGPPGEVCTRRNLEVAYGLGALHQPSEQFLDDPHAEDDPAHEHTRHQHPH